MDRFLILLGLCLPALAHANGDVLGRLALQLREPIAWAALSGTAEGRAIGRRVLGRPLREAADIDPFVQALGGVTDSERIAQELHVRLFRIQREALGTYGELSDVTLGPLAKRLLGIRSMLRNPLGDLRRIRFAEPVLRTGTAAREAFLTGADLPAESALRRLSRGLLGDWRVKYLLFETTEGREFVDWVLGTRPWRDPATPEMLLDLLRNPEWRGLLIDVDLRVGLALEATTTGIHWNVGEQGMKVALDRHAADLLAVNWDGSELLVFRRLRRPVPRTRLGILPPYYDP